MFGEDAFGVQPTNEVEIDYNGDVDGGGYGVQPTNEVDMDYNGGGDGDSEDSSISDEESGDESSSSDESGTDNSRDSNYEMRDENVDMRDFRLHTDFEVEQQDANCSLEGLDIEMDDVMLDNDRMYNEKQRNEGDMDYLFHVGQVFGTKAEVKDMIKAHAVETRRQIRIRKDDLVRVRAVCEGDMEDGSHMQGVGSSSANKDEGPVQKRKFMLVQAGFLSNHLVTDLQDDPKLKVKSIKERLQRRFEVGVSEMKAYRAKMLAREHIIGNFRGQYGLLRDYIEKLKRTNPDTIVKLELEECSDPTSETRQFKRIYICLGSLKKGFKAIGRDLLGLDGAFLKSAWPGQLLTAVALDPNNGYYPVAYAVVEAETLNSWEWFLECLGDDLDINNRSKFTFMSDRQKGLIQAVDKLFPSAEHRFCERHIEDNLRSLFKGKLLRDALWKLTRCTSPTQYEREMNNLKNLNKRCHLWVSKIPPETWSRSHFSGRAMSDVLTNNMCECFNSKLVDGRDKPIITLLEYIREYVMRKIVTVLKSVKKEASRYSVHWNGEDHYQVSGPYGDQCVVNKSTSTCACRRWEITGIPCRHVVACIWVKGAHDRSVGRPETFVKPIYTMDRWKAVL
ncbi:uncharacterized protein LOC143613561 [Bidens hawaiensis]|uniref:uncharacterized protein LOC143613561 n=1 Tax=Bidens hawaiensis TaxID=980011 RepID=UPI00404A8BF4